MPFSASWHTLLEELDELADDAELVIPLSYDTFRVTDVQEHRVVVTFDDTGERRPVQCDQFETLYCRIQDSKGAFDLDRLPPDADTYPAVLSLHPQFEVDGQQGSIDKKEAGTDTQLLSDESASAESDRVEPDGIDVYSDALLLIDALERQDIADVLLDRLHHEKLRTLMEQLVGEYGDSFRTAITTTQVEHRLADLMEEAGVRLERDEYGDVANLMHYGEEKSRNDFATEEVGPVNGCMDPGDGYASICLPRSTRMLWSKPASTGTVPNTVRSTSITYCVMPMSRCHEVSCLR